MRSHLFAAISGALGLAALAVAAPAAPYADVESCAASASTVFVTVSEAHTVTLHDSPISYGTVGLSQLPTTTATRLTTRYSSTTTYVAAQTETISVSLVRSSSMKDTFSTVSSTYDYTVFETTVVTVTNSLAASETPASTDLLSFIVENGTTYWLNGQTPPPTASYVVETSVVTVMPVITPVTKLPQSSTVTEHSTVVYTIPLTITETLSASNSTSNTTSTLTASSFGTVVPSSWAGWNATSSAAGVFSTGGYSQLTTVSGAKFNNPYSTMSLITEESTLDIYHPVTATYTAASYGAQSGFSVTISGPASVSSQAASKSFVSDSEYMSSTFISASLPEPSLMSSTSSAIGEWTTAVISGQTVSWGGPTNTSSNSLSSVAPYSNTTSAVPASVTSSILGANTTCTEESSKTSMPYASNITSSVIVVITSAPVSLTSSALGADTTTLGANTTCTESSKTSVPYASNVTSSLSGPITSVPISQTSSALGADTTTLGSNTTCTEEQSQTMSYSVGSITSSLPTSTSSAIGVDTTLSYKPSRTSSTNSVQSSSSSFPVSTTSALGMDTTTSTDSLSSVTTAASSVLSSTDLGNITTFWTSQPMASLPSVYSTTISGSVIFTIHSESASTSSSSGAAMTTLQSTLSEFSSISVSASLSTSSSVLTSSEPAISTLSSTLSSISSVSVPAQLSSSSTVSSFSITSPPSTASTSLSQTATSVKYTTSALPSLCGEYGDFTLNFDDIPPLAASNDTANTVSPQPVFSPYHQFDFSDGFVVVPPPTDPYKPSSGKLLTEFIPNFNLKTSTPQSGPNSAEFGWSGDIGNADHGALGCFNFNVYNASFGCDSKGPDCMFSFTGFKYDNTTKLPVKVISRIASIPACPALANCDLVPITLDQDFKNLDVFRISLTVAGEPKIWWMDDLHMGWADNTCDSGLCRQNCYTRAVKQLTSR